MGFPKEIYDKAAAVLSSRRQAAKEQSLRHRQEIYRLLPQIEQIDSQLRRIGMQTIQAVAGSPERLDTIIERLKQQSLGLQKQRGRPAGSGRSAGNLPRRRTRLQAL